MVQLNKPSVRLWCGRSQVEIVAGLGCPEIRLWWSGLVHVHAQCPHSSCGAPRHTQYMHMCRVAYTPSVALGYHWVVSYNLEVYFLHNYRCLWAFSHYSTKWRLLTIILFEEHDHEIYGHIPQTE